MTRPRPAGLIRAPAAAALSIFLGAFVASTAAQTVYRCGSDGREYSQTPCPQGRLLEIDAPPGTDQRQAAEDAARREAQLADRLTRERHARDEEALRQNPGAIGLYTLSKAIDEPAAAAPNIKKAAHKKSARGKRKNAKRSAAEPAQQR